MEPRADTILCVQRRLMGVHFASEGVLRSERLALEWSWLEVWLSEGQRPRQTTMVWNLPLSTGRMAICRLLPTRSSSGAGFAVALLLLDRLQHEWFVERIQVALRHTRFWAPAQLMQPGGVTLPAWPEDVPPDAQCARLATKILDAARRRPIVVPPNIPSAMGRDAVLHAVSLVPPEELHRFRWSVGLPGPVPGAAVAQVCAAGAPVESEPSAPAVETSTAGPQGPPAVQSPLTAAPKGAADQITADLDDPTPAEAAAQGDAGIRVEIQRTGGSWLVPALCCLVMATAVAMAAFLRLKGLGAA